MKGKNVVSSYLTYKKLYDQLWDSIERQPYRCTKCLSIDTLHCDRCNCKYCSDLSCNLFRICDGCIDWICVNCHITKCNDCDCIYCDKCSKKRLSKCCDCKGAVICTDYCMSSCCICHKKNFCEKCLTTIDCDICKDCTDQICSKCIKDDKHACPNKIKLEKLLQIQDHTNQEIKLVQALFKSV